MGKRKNLYKTRPRATLLHGPIHEKVKICEHTNSVEQSFRS